MAGNLDAADAAASTVADAAAAGNPAAAAVTPAALAKLGVVALAEAATSVTLANASSIVLHSEPLALVELGTAGTASLGAQLSSRIGQLSTEACAAMVQQLALVQTRQDPAPVAAPPPPPLRGTRTTRRRWSSARARARSCRRPSTR